jgi:hypothetical protein
MREKTILSFIETLEDIKDSGLSINAYCKAEGKDPQSIYSKMQNFKKNVDSTTDYYNKVVSLYNSIVGRKEYDKISQPKSIKEPEEVSFVEKQDSDTNLTEVDYERDEDGKIVYYSYKIYRRNKAPLIGKFSRDEMNIIYRLYSYYGASLTQREVSRYFPELSLVDFRRILSAMNIYKASAPFAPHVIEENSEDELRKMQLREKENGFLAKIEEDRVRNNEVLLKKFATENAELKSQLDNLSKMKFEVTPLEPLNLVMPGFFSGGQPQFKAINVYLADMHIGATVCSGTLYKENINYNVNEVKRRLDTTIQAISELGTFDQVNICLMGDMMDCCGPTNKTARLDHTLPESMDGFEQANAYISLITDFVRNINQLGANIKLYSVRCGNHTGPIEYIATRALFAEITNSWGIETKLFDDFFGVFKCQDNTFVLTHGKDDRFMKKGMPLNIDDKNKVLIYEWLNDNGLTEDNIHIIKGDLHSNNFNSCKRFDYRNVLSLFGASDYSSFNFSRNSYGVSYDIVTYNGSVMRGEITDM